jgi:hypothetical protein
VYVQPSVSVELDADGRALDRAGTSAVLNVAPIVNAVIDCGDAFATASVPVGPTAVFTTHT